MRRRQAIRNIAIATAAAYLLPQCKNEPKIEATAYPNVPLTADQRKLVEQFTEALLPKANTQIQTPETTANFVLTVLNDCTSPDDVQKYLTGLKELQSRIRERYKTDFGSLPESQQAEVFAWLSGTEGLSAPLQYFFGTTRGLAIEHFTTSEYFLKNVMKWEFIPGYFKGCSPV